MNIWGGGCLKVSRLHFAKRGISKATSRKKFKSVVGLEVHAQISSASKLFSGSSTTFAMPVNKNVSLFDCATPGTLPVLNKRCVEAGVLTALALDCKINAISTFDRKHYFYADLPTGYQITQQRAPLANDGSLEFQVYNPGIHKKPYQVRSRIKQLQLEQDSGKSLHDITCSLVDLNRAGAPLMELVFEPDLTDGEEAAALVKELVAILQSVGTCSCKMEEGALRVDANVSVHESGQPLGVRTEIKNISSIRGVAAAVSYEIDRQMHVIEKGEAVVNETRAWNVGSKTTVPMRDKEEKQDYRYMPEPNLPPLHIATDEVEWGCVKVADLRARLPELPRDIRNRLQTEHGLTLSQAAILVNEAVLLKTFNEAVVGNGARARVMSNLLANNFLEAVHKRGVPFEEIPIKGAYFAEIDRLLEAKTINHKTAGLLIDKLLDNTTDSPKTIVEEEGWIQINDENEIRKICLAVVEENPEMVAQYKKGKKKVFNAIVGAVAKKTDRRVNMELAEKILHVLLDQ